MLNALIGSISRYRGFIIDSIRRDFQSRYQSSFLGALWLILQPVAMISVYTLVFSSLMRARLPDMNSPFAYSIYLCSGVLTWGLFTETLNGLVNVFLNNANILKKLNFPRICLPIIVSVSSLINFLIIFALFVLFMLVSGTFPHPEWAQAASRDCYDRIDTLGALYDQLAAKLGRPLRVLDLGCAQGFFCLSLAERGATVKGVDFQEQNIALCRALADENPQLDASFAIGRIEEVIDALEPGQYDLAIGLSVFHHIVHLHGVAPTQRWLARLAECIEAVILEIALREEPLYWGPSQPAEPRELLRDCAFYHQIARFNTHLSALYRPLYVVSQHWLLLDGHCFAIMGSKAAPAMPPNGC